MAKTPQQFFQHNWKWIVLIITFLFLFKSVQSCNRKMKLNISDKTYINMIDSLKKNYYILEKSYNDTVKKLNFELKLANEQVNAANKRADAVQSAVEKIRSNTTITVKGAEEVKDTSKK